MGRPRIANPKNKHIGIVTTEEKYRRFKALGLVGDEAIDVLLYYLEKENKELQVKKMQTISNIKNIQKSIEELEFEKLKEETKLDQINEKIGLAESGLNRDVQMAVGTILQRFKRQSVYNIIEFLENEDKLLEDQAFSCGISIEELWQLCFDNA